jgi:hypothetical protein
MQNNIPILLYERKMAPIKLKTSCDYHSAGRYKLTVCQKNSEVNKQEKQENHVTQRCADAVAMDVREIGSELD